MTATCPCSGQCELGYDDHFQPATRELMVFTKSPKRYFDLDAVRHEHKDGRTSSGGGSAISSGIPRGVRGDLQSNPVGAPPLDWWQIPSPKPQPISPYEGPPMTATMYIGDVLDVLGKLPENSVDLVLSSPPFLALRSYLPSDHPLKEKEGGSQSTPGEYIDWLIDVVEACDRVLAPHGSLCFELGDTYASDQGRGPDWTMGGEQFTDEGLRSEGRDGGVDGRPTIPGRRMNTVSKYGKNWPLPKSLSLIPESFRFAMVYGQNPFTGRQTGRWRLRNVIRWVRPNPPVGALGDKFRPATSELMVFCKSAKRYFDLDAVREPYTVGTLQRGSATRPEGGKTTSDERGGGWSTLGPFNHKTLDVNHGAPPLDWWNIPPGGYEGAHYAVWPPELLIKPIKAMCPEQVCRTCGEARRRIVGEVSYTYGSGVHAGTPKADASLTGWEAREDGANRRNVQGVDNGNMVANRPTLGFTDCGHNDYRPGLVLDPFVGSGTTLSVATGYGRDAIGIDLDERNYDLALERVGPLVLQRGEVAA